VKALFKFKMMEDIIAVPETGSPAALKPTDKTPSPDALLDQYEDRPVQRLVIHQESRNLLTSNLLPSTNDYTFYVKNDLVSPFAYA
jgi:hypothetical protein